MSPFGSRMINTQCKLNACSVGWLAICLVAIGGLSAVWVLAMPAGLPGYGGFPNTASTTLLFMAGAALCHGRVPARYKWSVVAGLGFSAIGDAFLMLASDRFVLGLVSFLLAHVCYLWAFTCSAHFAVRRTPFVVWGLFGVIAVCWLWPGVPSPLRIPVVLYSATLLAMAAQGAALALSRRTAAAIAVAFGGALFAVSDTVLAMQRFGHPVERGRLIVLGTYFVAQGCIAVSVLLSTGVCIRSRRSKPSL